MQFKFQKEEHNRQDKAKKADYMEDIRERLAKPGNWSGVNVENLNRRMEIRQLELRRAETLYFVYGKWLYQRTKKLSHFARLNACHCNNDDPELPTAFEKCHANWHSDFKKIVDAINSAPIMRPKNLPKWLPVRETVAWDLPADLIANEVWRKPPPAFQTKK